MNKPDFKHPENMGDFINPKVKGGSVLKTLTDLLSIFTKK